MDGRRVTLNWGEERISAAVVITGVKCTVFMQGRRFDFDRSDPEAILSDADDDVLAGAGHLHAPMSGKVLSLVAVPGVQVDKGAALLVMEAMKMEHTITAPAEGMVREFRFAAGDQVAEGAELVSFEIAKPALDPS